MENFSALYENEMSHVLDYFRKPVNYWSSGARLEEQLRNVNYAPPSKNRCDLCQEVYLPCAKGGKCLKTLEQNSRKRKVLPLM